MAGNLPFHPAPGTANGGKLPPGFYEVQNTPAAQAAYGVRRSVGIAEIIPAYFTTPANPVKAVLQGQVQPLGVSGCGCGCGGGCGCNKGTLNGMGDFSTDWSKFTSDFSSAGFMTAVQDPILSIPSWVWIAGLALVFFGDFGRGSHYVRGRRAARAAASAY
jgi:hypothetical protein